MEDLKMQLAVGWQTKVNKTILRNFYRFVLNHRPVNAKNSTNVNNHLFSNLFDKDRKNQRYPFFKLKFVKLVNKKRLLYKDTNR